MSKFGQRLKYFAEKEFTNPSAMAKFYGKDRNYFRPYISGKSMMGGEMLLKLHGNGCDLNWLIAGELETKELRERADRIEKLKDECLMQKEEIGNRLSNEINDKDLVIDELEHEIEDLEELNSSLVNKYNTLIEKYNSREKMVKETKELLEKHSEEIKELKLALTNLTEQLTTKNKMITVLEEENAKLITNNEQLGVTHSRVAETNTKYKPPKLKKG